MDLYLWIKWLHILFVLVFFIGHGISMGVAFRMTSEKDPNRLTALLDLSRWSLSPMTAGLLGVLVFGLVLTFMGPYRSHIWPWLSLVLLLGMSVWMTLYSRAVYMPIRKALGLEYMTGMGKTNPPVAAGSMDEVTGLIAKSNPRLLAIVGLLFTLVIVWLMVLKPF
jgi:hypothetical protein